MNKFKFSFKKVIKVLFGYQIERIGHRGFSVLNDTVKKTYVHPGSLLVIDKTIDLQVRLEGIYNYLRQLKLEAILREYQINVILDVGANSGQFALDMRRMGFKNKIISFEPALSAFKVLQGLAKKDENWEVFNFALGNKNEELELNVADVSVFTSFLKTNDWCKEHFGKESVGSKKEVVEVKRLVNVLKTLFNDFDDKRIYLKMDTQGFDREVFSGLGELQHTIVALQTEMSVIPIYEKMPHLTESISFFENAGFEIAGMFPVNQEKDTLRVVEYDCLMVDVKHK
jgi:FkbM family methyltransferase